MIINIIVAFVIDIYSSIEEIAIKKQFKDQVVQNLEETLSKVDENEQYDHRFEDTEGGKLQNYILGGREGLKGSIKVDDLDRMSEVRINQTNYNLRPRKTKKE
jgi:hypothetical protein